MVFCELFLFKDSDAAPKNTRSALPASYYKNVKKTFLYQVIKKYLNQVKFPDASIVMKMKMPVFASHMLMIIFVNKINLL